MILLSALLYTITDVCLVVILLSYLLALKISKSVHILALILFFFSVLCLTSVATLDLWSLYWSGDVFRVPFSWLRGLFLAVSSSILLYTTWRKETPIKITELDSTSK